MGTMNAIETEKMMLRDVPVPSTRPRLKSDDLHELMAPYAINRQKYPLMVIGIRGYYIDSLGEPGQQDRGIYDDAIFFDSIEATVSFNANADPSYYRPGIASLKRGFWPSYKIDYHRGEYLALCQRNGEVTVIRDVQGEETGYFGINIHRGSIDSTSSLGCQTIYPYQWDGFINLVIGQAKKFFGLEDEKWKETTIPYLLLEAVRWEGNKLIVKGKGE
jgi:hypothetical protein